MSRLGAWFRENRHSARAAFALRTVCMAANALLGLFWTRWLLRAFGQENYGLYMSFLAFLGLASAGELGMGGAVTMRTTQLLATGQVEEARRFHGMARRAFLALSLAMGGLALLLSPWLPGWLHFQSTLSAGSMTALFAVGAANVFIAIYSSYLTNAAYAAGTVLWPILPGFLLSQGIAATQWSMGSAGQPLWLVQGAVALVNLTGLAISFQIYRRSHPVFAERLPYPRGGARLRALTATSFWSYLFSLAVLVYFSTDRLLVNAFLGAATVPVLFLNNKLCELAITVITTASAVAMPALVTRLLSHDAATRNEARAAAWKLSRLQALLGIGAAFGYLWIDDLFVSRMFGHSLLAPAGLEAALATSLVLGANLDVYVQLAGLDSAGLRFAAWTVLGSAILNFTLSALAAAWLHWLPGVAWATCLSQATSLIALSAYVQRRDQIVPLPRLLLASFVWPLGFMGAGIVWHHLARGLTWPEIAGAAGGYAALVALYMLAAGPGWRDLREEIVLGLRRFGVGLPVRSLIDNPVE